jgi:hypothetical protein
VLVDSKGAGKVSPGETLELPVAPGEHSVQIAIDWARSPTLSVDVGPGETVYLRCAPNTGQSPLVGATVGRGKYVSLWRADSTGEGWSETLLSVPWGRFVMLALLLTAAGIALASGREFEAVIAGVFALLPAIVIVAWLYARIRRRPPED